MRVACHGTGAMKDNFMKTQQILSTIHCVEDLLSEGTAIKDSLVGPRYTTNPYRTLVSCVILECALFQALFVFHLNTCCPT